MGRLRLWTWILAAALLSVGGGLRPSALRAAELEELTLTEDAEPPGPEISAVIVEGPTEADRQLVREQIRSAPGMRVDEERLAADRRRIEALGRFVAKPVQTRPDFGGRVKLVFQVYYRTVELDLQLDEAGRVSVRLGPHQLLEPGPAGTGRLEWTPGAEPPPDAEAGRAKARPQYDPETRTLTVAEWWGRYTLQYAPAARRLDVTLTVENATEREMEHLRIYATGRFKFPRQPAGYWWNHGRVMTGDPAKAPPVVTGDYGQGAVVACLPEMPEAVRFGFRDGWRLTFQLSGLPAGATRTVRGSLRFGRGRAAEGEPLALVQDIYDAFAAAHPRIGPDWPDRRPIAMLHPSSASLGLLTAGNPKNPRGWKLGRPEIDITTEEGRGRFREELLAWAERCVRVCRGMNAQGGIIWSVEGQQYPHAISYIGAPDKLARLAPEMDAAADEFFQVFAAAGLRTGVTIRPQELQIPEEAPQSATAKPKQRQLWDGDVIPVERIIEVLDRKLTYARERWGCSIFYVDSNVSSKWAKDEKTGKWRPVRWETMPVAIFQELCRRHPDCLILPEHEYFLYWSCAAPLARTSEAVQRVWPQAFSANLMQDFQPGKPESVERFGTMVARGDILMFRGWFNDRANPVIRELYIRHHNPAWHGPKEDWLRLREADD